MKSKQPFYFLACFLLFGTASDALADQETSLRGLPIVIYVQPIDPFDDDIGWWDILGAHNRGKPIYSPRYRDPAIEPVRVDCPQTSRIGVYMTIDYEDRADRPIRPFRFDWTHDGISVDGPQKSSYGKPFGSYHEKYRYRNRRIYGSTLSLTDIRRVDGAWRLDVYHLGEHIYEREILLEGCDEPYVPREFQSGKRVSPLYQLDPPMRVSAYRAPALEASELRPEPSLESAEIAKSPKAPAPQPEKTTSNGAPVEPPAEAAEDAVTEPPPERPLDVALIAQIDATIGEIDAALDGYIHEYLDDLGIDRTEFRDIERKLERSVRRERRAYPETYKDVPNNIHRIQTKVRFLKSVHKDFADGNFPASLTEKLKRLAELEAQL